MTELLSNHLKRPVYPCEVIGKCGFLFFLFFIFFCYYFLFVVAGFLFVFNTIKDVPFTPHKKKQKESLWKKQIY